MSCPREEDLLEHFAGEPSASIATHLAECDRCRAIVAELGAALRLAPDDGEFDDPELARDVATLIKLDKLPARKPARWPYAAAAITAIAASLLLFVQPNPSGFSPRGVREAPDRWVSIEVFRAHEGETGYRKVEANIATEDALLFTMHNRPESPYRWAMILAFDDRGEVFWYYPAYGNAAEDPVSIPAPPSAKPIALEEAVRHQLAPGWLRVVGLFSKQPLDVKSVEASVARAVAEKGSAKDVERIPIPDTGQHAFLLRAEAR